MVDQRALSTVAARTRTLVPLFSIPRIWASREIGHASILTLAYQMTPLRIQPNSTLSMVYKRHLIRDCEILLTD